MIKYQRLTFFLILVSITLGTSAQVAKKSPLLKLSNVYGYLNFQQIVAPAVTLEDFREMAPNSEILNRNYSEYEESMERRHAGNGGFDLMVGLNLRNKKDDGYSQRWKLRAGVGYSVGVVLHSSLKDEKYQLYDTINFEGTDYFVDSVTLRYTDVRLNSDYLRLQFSAITYTDRNARWALYGGLGLYASYAYNNAIEIEYKETNTVNGLPYGHPLYDLAQRNTETRSTLEAEELKPEIGGALYAPLGLDFRVGSTSEFWRKVHFFFEVQLGVDVSQINSLGTYVRPFGTTGVGFRITS